MLKIKLATIKAVTVCVNYSDYLEMTIANNKKVLDDWVIVTSPNDSKTINLCKRRNVRCIITRRLHENGDVFNKGKALNDGLAAIKNYDWLLSMDADIILPNNFRNIKKYLFDKNYLYGVPRYTGNLNTISAYLRGKEKFSALTLMPPLEEIKQWIFGYFQLFHKSRVRQPIYPEDYYHEIYGHGYRNSAAFYDLMFAQQFKKQMYLDKIKVIHLPHKYAENWEGRKEFKC